MGSGGLCGGRASTGSHTVPDGTTTSKDGPATGRVVLQRASTARCVGMRCPSPEQEQEDETRPVAESNDFTKSLASDASDLEAKRQLALQAAADRGSSKESMHSGKGHLSHPTSKMESKLLQRRKSGAGVAALGLTIDPTKLVGAVQSAPPALQSSGDATPKLIVTTTKIYALDDLPVSPKRTLGPPGEIPADFNRNRRGSAPF